MAKGIIYVMSTCIEGLVKIGKTGINNFEQRMSYIEREGYHRIPVLNREFAIEVDDYDEKELLLHGIFSKSRIGKSELFSVDVNIVKQLMSSMDGKVIYPENESKNDIFEQATEIVQSKSGIIPNGTYTLTKKKNNIIAKLVVNEGNLVLKKGSILADVTTLKRGWLNIRNGLILENNKMMEDLVCDSPSMASSIVVGYSSNGWDLWKNDNGEKIDVYRKNEESIED